MAVMAREAWTDERLDDLNAKVDNGFADMRAEFRAVRAEAAAMNRTMLQVALAGQAVMVVGFIGTIATIITQM